MPHIHESTPKSPYTISGETFHIHQPYTPGHALTENEAKVLNQVLAENVRNNQAKFIKDLKEKGTFDHAAAQATLDAYVASYEFGNRSVSTGTRGDPVRSEAIKLAAEAVKAKIAKTGRKVSDYTATQIRELAVQAIDSGKNPQFIEEAKARIAAAKDLAGLELDSLDAPQAEEKAPKASKPKAA